MAAHDELPRPLRDLTNEFGFNAVVHFADESDTVTEVKELLGMWRANRQRDLLKLRR